MPHLEEAVRRHPTPRAWYNLALAYRGAGRIAAAVDAFDRYLAAPDPDELPARIVQIRAERTNLLRSVGRIQVNVTPADVAVRVDGREATLAGGEVRVDPGTHSLEFEAQGRQTLRREVNLQAGMTLVLELQLPPIEQRPAQPAAPTATPVAGPIVVGPTVPGAAVRLTPSPEQPGRRRGWVLPVVIAGGAAVLTGIVVGVALATRGEAAPSQGTWETVREP